MICALSLTNYSRFEWQLLPFVDVGSDTMSDGAHSNYRPDLKWQGEWVNII